LRWFPGKSKGTRHINKDKLEDPPTPSLPPTPPAPPSTTPPPNPPAPHEHEDEIADPCHKGPLESDGSSSERASLCARHVKFGGGTIDAGHETRDLPEGKHA